MLWEKYEWLFLAEQKKRPHDAARLTLRPQGTRGPVNAYAEGKGTGSAGHLKRRRQRREPAIPVSLFQPAGGGTLFFFAASDIVMAGLPAGKDDENEADHYTDHVSDAVFRRGGGKYR